MSGRENDESKQAVVATYTYVVFYEKHWEIEIKMLIISANTF
jgi:hypothetical protein